MRTQINSFILPPCGKTPAVYGFIRVKDRENNEPRSQADYRQYAKKLSQEWSLTCFPTCTALCKHRVLHLQGHMWGTDYTEGCSTDCWSLTDALTTVETGTQSGERGKVSEKIPSWFMSRSLDGLHFHVNPHFLYVCVTKVFKKKIHTQAMGSWEKIQKIKKAE